MHLRAEGFWKMCTECGIVDNVRVLKEDCNVVYRSQVSKRADRHTLRGAGTEKKNGKLSMGASAFRLKMKHDPGLKHTSIKKMHFSDFLTALADLSKRRYGDPTSEEEDEAAFEKLLMENLIPFARYRRRILAPTDEVQGLAKRFLPSFRHILQYYGEFIGDEEKQNEKKHNTGRMEANAGMNSMASNLSFPKWLQFCDDFNLRSSLNNVPILTSVELAEIFLQSVQARTVDYLGKLNINEFWEAIVRCAQVAFKEVDTSMVRKLKELFIIMSHKIDKSISDSVNFTGHRDVSTYGALIISGMKSFQLQLNIMYREDGLPLSYLSSHSTKKTGGRSMLSNIIARQAVMKKQHEKAQLSQIKRDLRRQSWMSTSSAASAEDVDASGNFGVSNEANDGNAGDRKALRNRDAALRSLLISADSKRDTTQRANGTSRARGEQRLDVAKSAPASPAAGLAPVAATAPLTVKSPEKKTNYRLLLQRRQAAKMRRRGLLPQKCADSQSWAGSYTPYSEPTPVGTSPSRATPHAPPQAPTSPAGGQPPPPPKVSFTTTLLIVAMVSPILRKS